MNLASHKVNQYLPAILKLFVLCVFGWVIYAKISYLDGTVRNFFISIWEDSSKSILWMLFFIVLAGINWFFEILKWKTLVNTTIAISFKTALKQSLASLTVSLATPNRIGEYGAKAYFFKPELRKKVMLLNFYAGLMQMVVTTGFGILGILILVEKYGEIILETFSKKYIVISIGIILLSLIVGFLVREKQLFFKGLTLHNLNKKLSDLPVLVKWKVFLFSWIRYLVFSLLFFKILQFYGVSITLFEAFPILFVMYFLASVIPTFLVLDMIAKGGIAIWLFSFLGVSEIAVAATVFTMWLLNFIFPAILGSYYVICYKPENT